jgi:hydroxypyruvate isomerase
MPKFAANLSMLFTEHPLLARFERAAAAGFTAVELQFPYDHAADEIKAQLDAHGLQLVLHNLPPGDWAAGERGIACHPDRVAEFRDSVAVELPGRQGAGRRGGRSAAPHARRQPALCGG